MPRGWTRETGQHASCISRPRASCLFLNLVCSRFYEAPRLVSWIVIAMHLFKRTQTTPFQLRNVLVARPLALHNAHACGKQHSELG